MAHRLPKPWQWKARRDDWYITVNRRKHWLCPCDTPEADVRRLALEKLVECGLQPGVKAEAALAVLQLLERYLTAVYYDHSAQTYRVRRANLRSFGTFLKGLQDQSGIVLT